MVSCMSKHTTIVKTLDQTIERLLNDGADTDALAQSLLAHAIGLKIGKGASVDDICVEVNEMIRRTAQNIAENE